MTRILITGANGQLGRCLRDASEIYQDYHFTFATREDIDFTDEASIVSHFRSNDYDYCINCAAYTNVDQAQKEESLAFKINADAVKLLAEICNKKNITLLHVSTDYVFDGQNTKDYTETDFTNPINVYGTSKLSGEHYVQSICKQYFIIRTSWLYSQYGNNFLKTILKHGALGTELKITTEQTGTPTNANDLAETLLKIVKIKNEAYGVYHYSNEGNATWYDFAKKIIELQPQLTKANLASTDHYPTFAQRPKRSVLDCSKIEKVLGVESIKWKESLEKLIELI
ncbi:NAD(P)-dependent oxidoreductase [Patiriisocius marinistellae]|uniref:dTDP-4-dehydrorhamnose reductase n=1 Tax=Patiriisocius marinistellae TaxID=2494560 RepID=A0A5J4FUM3_9FLAO|nr:dTDP-4-dehydrorhamnose reductase [Patiriisocius marinistellae]GEQ84858.1 NAD(P)-dependent oxidoreductase [Patiriisocius marinistellae]